MKRYCCLLLLAGLSLTAYGQETINADRMQRIRDEGLNHSRIMDIAHNLTDVAGPRLTNSLGYDAAMRADKLPRKPLPEAAPWMFAEFH